MHTGKKLLSQCKTALRLVSSDPRLLFYKAYYTITGFPEKSMCRKVGDIHFEFDFRYNPAAVEMYCGSYEKEVVAIMKQFLKKGHCFIDVGANIGYVSAVAAGCVGLEGEVHSFEPVPDHYMRLAQMAALNKDYAIFTNECAIGDTAGSTTINITNISTNIGWNTMVPSFMEKDTIKESRTVRVSRLDDYIKEKFISRVDLIKIDVEGYEFPVLRGLSGYFANTGHRPPIICEIAPKAYPMMGCMLDQLVEYMKTYDYKAYSIVDIGAMVDITKFKNTDDVIFLSANSIR